MKSIMMTMVFMATIGVLSAQGPVPANGFWEVVSNVAAPDVATVKFYDLNNHLIYEEHITGVELDLSKRRTLRRLNRSLRSALFAWNTSKEFMKDKGLVAMEFGERRKW